MTCLYVNSEHIIHFLAESRKNQRIPPAMDAALLNVQ